jgi:hypothetical protein
MRTSSSQIFGENITLRFHTEFNNTHTAPNICERGVRKTQLGYTTILTSCQQSVSTCTCVCSESVDKNRHVHLMLFQLVRVCVVKGL